jgi:catalase
MPFEDAAGYRFNPFDVTKVWPHADYPPIEVGRMVLDTNPANHFAEVEQAAFAPSNLVPGIGLSPDKMLMGRVFSYHDTHLHRIGVNYEQLPINAPYSAVHTYNKDGAMTYRDAGSQPVYAPNSYGGPQAVDDGSQPTWAVEAGELGRYAYELHAEDDDFIQARALYREVMDESDREHLMLNIAVHASDHVSGDVQRRVVAYWSQVDAELGARIAVALD